MMHFFFTDFAGLALATLLACFLVVSPGFAIALMLRRHLTIDGSQGLPMGWELLIGTAILPVLDALIIRFVGLDAMIVMHGLLAVIGTVPMLRAMRVIQPVYLKMLATWWVVVAASYVDFDYDGRMNQSLLIIDLVKHSAIINTIATTGLPLNDAFFLRPETAGYYYYFYITGAAIDHLGGAWIDSRMAFASSVFITGVSFPVLLWVIARQANWITPDGHRKFLNLCIGLCLISGLDLIAALVLSGPRHGFDGQIDWWDDEISFALSSLMWVPHHLTAIIASFLSFMLLCHAREAHKVTRNWLIVAAGFGLASVFGLSIWVALGAGAVLILWLLPDLLQRRFDGIAHLFIAGMIALILSIPQFMDLLGGRHTDGAVMEFWIRQTAYMNFPPLVALAILPFAYFLELGFFLFGTIAFLRGHPARQWIGQPLPRLLFIGAVGAIFLNAFVRSSIINNDFGWRVAWFAQIPMMVWTAVALQYSWSKWPLKVFARFALVLGIGANIWSLAGWRVIRPPLMPTSWSYVNRHSNIDYESRKAYEWANANLANNAILQHNPAGTQRVFNFGLYSRNRVALADSEAALFGADPGSVAARLATLKRIYSGRMTNADITTNANAQSIDYLLITADDPLWIQISMTPKLWPCVYRSATVCIVNVEKPR
jgi:hypothetical protein